MTRIYKWWIRLTMISIILFLSANCALAGTVKGKVVDHSNNEALPYATVTVIDFKGKKYNTVTDADGWFAIDNVLDGRCRVRVEFVGYVPFERFILLSVVVPLEVRLVPDEKQIGEVVVTAREGRGITSSSVINRQAIEHLQPSSFTDLLSLLPGGHKSLPDLTNANTITLRQAGTGNSNYDISSLGTMFVTDGVPINSDANMQQVRQASNTSHGDLDAGRNHVGAGVDMRTISTDNIESVEVIRGIAPVEYGDITSGVVIIKRKLKPTPFEARFKADAYSKLLYVGKGIQLGNFITNLSADYLDAKADPRNSLNNYKRLTLSARLQNSWKTCGWQIRWRQNVDYAGSFDNQKFDAEILKQKDDRYRSSYNRYSISESLLAIPIHDGALKSISLDAALAYEQSRIDQDRFVSLSRDVGVSTTLEEGGHDGIYLPYSYVSHVTVDGRPLNAYAKLKALFGIRTGSFTHDINSGVEWKMDKNYGHGQQYNPARPLSPGTPYRPRDYGSIPAGHEMGIYVQDVVSIALGEHQLTGSMGLRASGLLNLDRKYSMQAKPYLDPRFNFQWRLPSMELFGHELTLDINGGWGRQTKFPTLLQIYPDRIYNDIIELNYFNLNPDYRRLYLKTYVIDPTNFALEPARNNKWEVRLGGEWNDNTVSVTWFREVCSSGFRSSSIARPFSYRDYDERSIAPGTLTARPELSDFSYTDKTILGLYSRVTNGSKLVKEGIEWQLSTRRFSGIKTRFTVSGAYFRTQYANSEPMFRSNTSAVVAGVPVNDLYIGYYDNSSGTVREQFNTNFMADTHLPRLGLTFSFSAECMWFSSSQSMRENGVPTAYMATDGKIYPYTEASKTDPYLKWLETHYNPASWERHTVPFYALVNLKVTKNFGRWMKIALFIDRMLDYMPDYKSNSGMTIRRTSKPYFGMEMNISI